jgi:hypothetical protein
MLSCRSRFYIVPLLVGIALAMTGTAQASVFKKVEDAAITVAHARYHKQGIMVSAATCKRNGRNWKCVWLGADKDGYPVYGRLGLAHNRWYVLNGVRDGYPDHV